MLKIAVSVTIRVVLTKWDRRPVEWGFNSQSTVHVFRYWKQRETIYFNGMEYIGAHTWYLRALMIQYGNNFGVAIIIVIFGYA